MLGRKLYLMAAFLMFWAVLPAQAEFYGMSDWDLLMVDEAGNLGNPTQLNMNGNPPYTLSGFTFIDYNVPAEDLVLGVSVTDSIEGRWPNLAAPPVDMDDFDLNGLTTKNSHMPEIWITMLGGSPTWQNTNGDEYDFFIFEGGGNDQFSVAPILVPELPGNYGELSGRMSELVEAGVVGQAVGVPASTWKNVPEGDPQINLNCTARNGGQPICGIAWKVTDMKDANGDPLTNESVIYGVVVSSGGMDPGTFCAINGVPEAPAVATDPLPSNGSIMNALDTQLVWVAGKDATEQTLYFSTNEDDVMNGVGGVTVTGESHDPGALEAETVYYWRIDTSDGTEIHAGEVWSFTTVPAGADGLSVEYFTGEDYLAGDPVVTQVDPEIDFNWNEEAPDAGIDREQFSARWRGEISIPVDGKYIFILNSNDGSRLYLDGRLLVNDWSNHGRRDTAGSIELVAGTYPIRVEFYQDGGNAGISVSWASDLIDQQVIPAAVLSSTVRAGLLSPAAGAEQVSQDAVLSWMPASSSSQSDVYLGTDADAVDNADTSNTDIYQGRQDGDSLSLAELELGVTYYWRVDQVDGEIVTKGLLWSFTVAPAWVIDDMESYTPDFDAGETIYLTWIDGFDNPTENGAVVGNDDDPEYDLVNYGVQSMPLHYNNTVAKVSEATRTFDSAQDWSQVQGQTTTDLELWVRGNSAAGEFSYDAERERYTIGGTGEGFAGPADSFRFVYKQLTGDGVITARLLSFTALTDQFTPQGIMIRETLEPGSACVMTTFQSGQQAFMQTRTTAEADSVRGQTVPEWPASLLVPQWLRLTRSGDTFTAEISVDNTTWETLPDPLTIPMDQTVYVGIAVTADQPNDDRQVNVTTWDGVDISGTVDADGPLAKFADIGLSLNSEEEMYVVIEDSAGNSAVSVNPAGSQITQVQAFTPWNIDLSTLTGVDLTQVEKMTIGVGKKAAPVNNGAGSMFIDDIRLLPQAPELQVNTMTSIEAEGSDGMLIALDGTPIGDLVLGVTTTDFETFADHPAADADNFSLGTYASLDDSNWIRIDFSQPVTTIYVIERNGNDLGFVQALDAAGNTVGKKVPFATSDWFKTEYTIGGGQVASGIVITSDLPIYGIEVTPDGTMGLDPTSVSAVPAP